MNDLSFNAIFSNRLRYFLQLNDMTQLELSRRLGVGTTSVSNWCNGIKVPRMDKVDMMCSVFNCKRSDLMEMPGTDVAEAFPSLSVSDAKLLALIKAMSPRQQEFVSMFIQKLSLLSEEERQEVVKHMEFLLFKRKE